MLGRNLRAVLYYARTGWRLKRVKDIVRAHPDLRRVGEPALGVISAFMNIDIKSNEQMEDVDMISAADELIEEGFAKGRKLGLSEGRRNGITEGRKRGLSEGRKRGLSEGRKRGITEGRNEERTLIVMNMHRNGMSMSDISRFTNISTRRLRKIVAAESTTGD